MANSLPRLYLDTSVPSAYYNDRLRDRQLFTQQIWHGKLSNYHLVISNITVKELGATKNLKRRKKLQRLVQRLDTCITNSACAALSHEYLNILSMPKYDALHIAIATVFSCEILLSWNFTHIVNDNHKQKINDINLLNGYQPITILSPQELRG